MFSNKTKTKTTNTTNKSSSHFSYLIQPITSCILGTENYDDKLINDDGFFVTAGGIVHSCPNIYELSRKVKYEDRKFQSCASSMLIDKRRASMKNKLSVYDTEFHHYSILPRIQPMPSSLSTDSINPEIEFYKQRYAIGLPRRCANNVLVYPSFLPRAWKLDNNLLFMLTLHHQLSYSNSIDTNKGIHSCSMSIK